MKHKVKKSASRNIGLLAACLLVPQIVGGLGSLATMPEITGWYAGLQKPSLNPPNWIFGPVWTALFLMMGYSLFLVARLGIRRHGTAIAVFGLQLALNALWSVLFFGLHHPDYAFAEILLLLGAIIWNAAVFYRINRWAGLLLVPYAGWVSFASFLTFMVWRLNRPF